MRYINRKSKQLIIDTPIHKSTTKTTTKNGKIKENIKYIAHIPNEVLMFLLEKFKTFDCVMSDVAYIDGVLNGDETVFLSFRNLSGDVAELQATNYKLDNDSGVSVTIKKQVNSNSYFFTVSKKVFSKLKDIDGSSYSFRYVVDLDSGSDCFKNFMVLVEIV